MKSINGENKMKFKIYLKEYLNRRNLTKICSEVSKEYNCELTHFRDIRKLGQGSYSYIPGYGDNQLWERATEFTPIFTEGISPEQYGLDKYKGGTIVFSTDVNAADLSKNKVKNFFLKKWKTLSNRLTKDRKLGELITNKFKEIGAFSIGNFFKGRYVSGDNIFNEKSASIEVLGIPSEVLIRLATEIARAFNQETVLFKDHETGRNILIDQK